MRERSSGAVGPLVVVYDFGSALPRRMAAVALARGWQLVFVLADSDHARAMKRTLSRFGEVVDAGGDIGEVVAQLRDHRPAGIVTFSEYQLALTAVLAGELGLAFPTPDDVHVLTDKAAQRSRLREAGVDDLPCELVTDAGELDRALSRVGLPAVVKPVVGVSSRNTSVVRTREEARDVVTGLLSGGPDGSEAREPAVVVEECLVGRPTPPPWADYMGVEVMLAGGRPTPMFTMSKFALAPPFRERGGYGPGSFEPAGVRAQVEDLACRAVTALGVRQGVAEVEVKLTPSGPRVIEVNGRLGGWVDDLANRTGVADPVAVALGCAMGLEPPPPVRDVDELAFQYLLHAPVEATRITSIHGVAQLRGLPAADRVFIRAREGSRVDWRAGSASSLGAVWGRAASLEELSSAIASIEATDWISYETE